MDALIEFASTGYEEVEPVPFHSSPFGPIGQTKGLLMKFGLKFLQIHEWLMEYGLSSTVAGCILALSTMVGSLIALIFIGVCLAPKEKED